MLTLGICVLIATMIFVTIIYIDTDDPVEAIGAGLLMGLVVGLTVGALVQMGVATSVYEKYTKTEKTDIVTLDDGELTSGKFLVLTAFVGEDPVYVYYTEDKGHDTVNQQTAPLHDTKVYEDQESKSYIIISKEKRHSGWWGNDFSGTDYTYEIHVPPGTVKREFSLNLEVSQ